MLGNVYRLILHPVNEEGENHERHEPVAVPFHENGHTELDKASQLACDLAERIGVPVQIVEYEYAFQDSNLLSTAQP